MLNKSLFLILCSCLLLFIILPVVAQTSTITYICPPCTTNCDDETFTKPGICPVCKMTLVDKAILEKETAAKVHHVEELKEDFKVFRDALEESHPNLYWYADKTSMNQAFDEANAALTHPMSNMDFFKVLMPVITKIGCGHTFMPIPAEVAVVSAKKGRFFPFDLAFLQEKAYIIGNNSENTSLPVGSKIISINGRKMEQITSRLFDFISMDNNTRTYKYKYLNENFSDFYHHFIESPESFQLEYIYQGKAEKATVPALTNEAIAKNRDSRKVNQNSTESSLLKPTDKVLSFDLLPDKWAAVIKIKSFNDQLMQAKGQRFDNFIDSAFREIKNKNISNLIIDIRGNSGGGTGNASFLYSYLTEKSFRVDQYMEVKTLPLQYIDFSGNLDSKGNHIELKKADFIQTSTGRFRLKKYPALDTVNPQNEPFKGKVYVLIDGWVASEGASLASLIHYAKRGTFIGEETGGAYNGTTGGILGNTYLPHSNLRITIPVFKIVRFTGKENEGKGIRPHVAVETSIEEQLAGKDPQLNYALKLIESN